jgi:hypothetical protein
MKKEINKIKLCMFCQKDIDCKKDKFVLLGTYKGENILDESYFHFKCFNEWYQTKVKEKAMNTVEEATQKASGILQGFGFGDLNLFGRGEKKSSGEGEVVDLV